MEKRRTLEDANKASNNFGPSQSKDPVALEGIFGEGREGRRAVLRGDQSCSQLVSLQCFKTKMYQMRICKAF